ncbi:peptidase C12, ubiquitin carboxyl-terminal hydrolase [Rhodocollybia butyracea]|uniref:Ubiquitin carboxyl-terminal hydrolase n=1 Tax=Rhodocollybia butyracea TaxID=206335 RepID=A0A9P5UF99_9AGAR|nr:peptidase C12, ubiquitin carboxyl-terminal hydrolase [Rhodocollybia butyracea]
MPRWIPLESNPEVLNSWANKAGLDKNESQFSDIYGFDPELLGMVPSPVKAVLLLFPITQAIETKRKEEDEKIKAQANSSSPLSPVIWIKQTISNACGTIGLLHSLANTGVKFTPGSPLAEFVEACKDKTPEERARFLETTPLFAEIHAETASTGQSIVPTDLDTDLHFTCFIQTEVQGVPHVVELDGRRAGPLDRGKVQIDLLTDVANLVKETYVKSSEGSIQFSMTSLGPPAEW